MTRGRMKPMGMGNGMERGKTSATPVVARGLDGAGAGAGSGIQHHVLPAVAVRGGQLVQVQVFGGGLVPDIYEVYLVPRRDRRGALAGYQAWYRKTGELFLPGGAGAGAGADIGAHGRGNGGAAWWPMVEALHRAAGDGDPARRRAHAMVQESPPRTWLGASEYLRTTVRS